MHCIRTSGVTALAFSLALATASVAQVAGVQAAPSARQKQLVDDFEKRVKGYLDLRHKQAGTSPAPTTSPEKLADTQNKLAARIEAARPHARQGDIFTPPIAAYFRSQIAASLKGEQGAKVRASLKHSEPLHGVAVKVNARYPRGRPLQSSPPSLLQNLPPLPKELEYRIINDDLVLHDIAADLVVDIVPHAIAAP